jgi:hypothetical protein
MQSRVESSQLQFAIFATCLIFWDFFPLQIQRLKIFSPKIQKKNLKFFKKLPDFYAWFKWIFSIHILLIAKIGYISS